MPLLDFWVVCCMGVFWLLSGTLTCASKSNMLWGAYAGYIFFLRSFLAFLCSNSYDTPSTPKNGRQCLARPFTVCQTSWLGAACCANCSSQSHTPTTATATAARTHAADGVDAAGMGGEQEHWVLNSGILGLRYSRSQWVGPDRARSRKPLATWSSAFLRDGGSHFVSFAIASLITMMRT